jgi:periodic tryptophan protein 1
MDDEDDDMPVFGDDMAAVMKGGGPYPMAIEDLSDDEKEDYYIKDSDALIVAGKIVLAGLTQEKEYASL